MAQNKEYINGIFITRANGQYGEYFQIGITKEGLKALSELPASEAGYRNVSAYPRKDNKDKFSVVPFVPKKATTNDGGTDDLPWN
ncbi:MAG TPA: hypothetical protein VD927_06300 [Chryseosolibacter sp.]|nr:hypothetical protein [Chryseosolibacter sp.]